MRMRLDNISRGESTVKQAKAHNLRITLAPLLQRAEQSGPAKQGAKQMSPHVGNFVQDLVEMAKAVEELPKVQYALDIANNAIELYAKQVQEREIAIIGYKEEIERHLSTIRSLEVSRDDAELRFLEADDTLANVLAMARASAVSLGQIITKLDPPKPEPTPVVIEERAVEQPQVVVIDPTIDHVIVHENVPDGERTSGQSEADPTASVSSFGEVQNESVPVTTTPVESITDVATTTDPAPGPYSGKRYRDVPGYIAIGDWLDGGGTKEDYYPRAS